VTTLKYDNFLVKISTTLNGANIKKRMRQAINSIVNFSSDSGTLVSTDHTSIV